jgi:hypothetical protein
VANLCCPERARCCPELPKACVVKAATLMAEDVPVQLDEENHKAAEEVKPAEGGEQTVATQQLKDTKHEHNGEREKKHRKRSRDDKDRSKDKKHHKSKHHRSHHSKSHRSEKTEKVTTPPGSLFLSMPDQTLQSEHLPAGETAPLALAQFDGLHGSFHQGWYAEVTFQCHVMCSWAGEW